MSTFYWVLAGAVAVAGWELGRWIFTNKFRNK